KIKNDFELIKKTIGQDIMESNPLWIKSFTAEVRETPLNNSKIIIELEQGEKVFMQYSEGDWYKIKIDIPSKLSTKYVSKKDFDESYLDGWIYHTFVSNEPVTKLQELERASIQKRIDRREEFIYTHPNISQEFKEAILNGTVILGMTKDMVIAIWGFPNDTNRTVTTYGTHEQLVYPDIYFYFEDGILTSLQD
ncbi:hypothetical protein MUP95_02815, partial [bacterium]|nr:hypothetical protein [bacterium]